MLKMSDKTLCLTLTCLSSFSNSQLDQAESDQLSRCYWMCRLLEGQVLPWNSWFFFAKWSRGPTGEPGINSQGITTFHGSVPLPELHTLSMALRAEIDIFSQLCVSGQRRHRRSLTKQDGDARAGHNIRKRIQGIPRLKRSLKMPSGAWLLNMLDRGVGRAFSVGASLRPKGFRGPRVLMPGIFWDL